MLKLSTDDVLNIGKYSASFLGASILYGLATTAFDKVTDVNTLPIPVEYIPKDPRILNLCIQLNEFSKYSPSTFRKLLYAIDNIMLIKVKTQTKQITATDQDTNNVFNLLLTIKGLYITDFMSDIAKHKDIKTVASIDKVIKELLELLGKHYSFVKNETSK